MLVSQLTEKEKKRYRQIKALMFLRDVRPSDIAARLNVTTAALTRTLRGQVKSRRIRQAIADALGKSYEGIWGSENCHKKKAA
jgi:DNA-binding transcriptional regulator LsrR (DeoR family)